MADERSLQAELAKERQRVGKLLEMEGRIQKLEDDCANRPGLRIVADKKLWGAGYVLFVLAMTLFYYDIRLMLGINVWSAMIIGIIAFSVAGVLFLLGMGIIREDRGDE